MPLTAEPNQRQRHQSDQLVAARCSGGLLSSPPPAEQSTERQDQARQSCTGDGAWDAGDGAWDAGERDVDDQVTKERGSIPSDIDRELVRADKGQPLMRTECGGSEIGGRAWINGHTCDVLIGEYEIERIIGIGTA